jgi:hypothetical protein
MGVKPQVPAEHSWLLQGLLLAALHVTPLLKLMVQVPPVLAAARAMQVGVQQVAELLLKVALQEAPTVAKMEQDPPMLLRVTHLVFVQELGI